MPNSNQSISATASDGKDRANYLANMQHVQTENWKMAALQAEESAKLKWSQMRAQA